MLYERYALCEAWRKELSREPFFAPSFLLSFQKNKFKKNFAKMFKRRSSKMLTSVICQVVYKSVNILRDDYLTGGLELKKEWESPL